MKRPRSEFALNLLIALGVFIALMGIVLHWWLPERYEKVEILPVAIGFAIALYCATWKDPNRSRRSAELVTDVGGKVVDSWTRLRTGKGKGAPIVDIVKKSDPSDPSAPPTTTVAVTTEEGGEGDPTIVANTPAEPAAQHGPVMPVADAPGKDVPGEGG